MDSSARGAQARLLHRVGPAGLRPQPGTAGTGDLQRNLDRAVAGRRRAGRAARLTIERQDAERREIETALYNGPGQDLAAALMGVEGLRTRWNGTDRAAAEADLTLLERAVAGALAQIRDIGARVRTPELADRDVAGVVERAVRDYRCDSCVQIKTILGELPAALPLALKIALFHALRELLAAAIADGRMSAVAVIVGSRHGWLNVRVAGQPDRGPAVNRDARGTRSAAVPGGALARTTELTDLLGGIAAVRRHGDRGFAATVTWPIADVFIR